MIISTTIKIDNDFNFLKWLISSYEKLYDMAQKDECFFEFVSAPMPLGVIGLSGKYKDMDYNVMFFGDAISPNNICRMDVNYKIIELVKINEQL